MDTLVILFTGQPQASFLRKMFYVDKIQNLRMGSKLYTDLFASLKCLSKARLIYSDSVFPGEEKAVLHKASEIMDENNVSVASVQRIILFDITFYPIDIEWLDHLLLKACDTDIPLFIYAGTARSKRLAGFCARSSSIVTGVSDEERANCSALSDKLADLLDAPTVLRLFSSNFSLRHFNSLRISNSVYFLKWSSQSEKMRAEYEFLNNLPRSIRPYFPQVGDFIEKDGGAGYEIEIIAQVDVSKALLNGVFSSDANCRRFVSVIEQYLNACPQRTASQDEYKAVARSIFVEKTQQRLFQLEKMPQKASLDLICKINGWEGINDFSEFALTVIEHTIDTDNSNMLQFSHGDLFFSNMLFDPLGGNLKLIDPRGSNGKKSSSTEFPIWYDLAKLSHSFLGHYDLMVHGLMSIVMNDNLRLALKSEKISGQGKLGEYFKSMLHRMHIPLERVRLYEGALFLSMIPLHSDSPLRMHMQLLRAMELFQNKEGFECQ